MIMDYRRTCFRELWYFGQGDDTAAWVEWFEAPTGARHFEEVTPFRSLDWWDGRGPLPARPGPVRDGPRSYRKGITPAGYTGQNPCGSLEYFRDGVPSPPPPPPNRDPAGVPDCCTGSHSGALLIESHSLVSLASEFSEVALIDCSHARAFSGSLTIGYFLPPIANAFQFLTIGVNAADLGSVSVTPPPGWHFIGRQSHFFTAQWTYWANRRPSANDTGTFVITGGPFFAVGVVASYSGVPAGVPFDASSRATGTDSPMTIGTLQVGYPFELICSAAIHPHFPTALLPTPPWSLACSSGETFPIEGVIQHRRAVFPGFYTAVADPSQNGDWLTMTAGFLTYGSLGVLATFTAIGVSSAVFYGAGAIAGDLFAAGSSSVELVGAASAESALVAGGVSSAEFFGVGSVGSALVAGGVSSAEFFGVSGSLAALNIVGTSSAAFVGAAGALAALSVSSSSSAAFVGVAGAPAALSVSSSSSAAFVSPAASLVVQTGYGTGSNSAGVTWGSTTGDGHLLVAAVCVTTGSPGGTVTITAPSGWTLINASGREFGDPDDPNSIVVKLYYKQNAAAQSSTGNWSFTVGGLGAGMIVLAGEYNTGVTSGSLDVNATSSGFSTSPASGTTGTLAQAAELAVAGLYQRPVPTFSSPSSGFTIEQQHDGGGTSGFHGALLDASLSATTGVAASVSSTDNAAWVGAIATFKRV